MIADVLINIKLNPILPELFTSLVQNHILFWLLILLFHQINLHVLARRLQRQYKR